MTRPTDDTKGNPMSNDGSDSIWRRLSGRSRRRFLLLILQSLTALATALAGLHYWDAGHELVGAVFAVVSWCSLAALVVSLYMWSRDAGQHLHGGHD